jgi:hypothetical protein
MTNFFQCMAILENSSASEGEGLKVGYELGLKEFCLSSDIKFLFLSTQFYMKGCIWSKTFRSPKSAVSHFHTLIILFMKLPKII